VNSTAHQVTGCGINGPVALEHILADEGGGDYGDFVMATVPGAGMAGVAMRFILDGDGERFQHGQSLAQQFDGVTAHAGRTFLKGLTVTLA